MPILDDKQDAIQALCQAFHVLRLEAFGDIIAETFNPARDIASFVVECEPQNARVQYERFFGLLRGLEVLLECRIDLVDAKAIAEGTVLQQIPETRKVMYAAKPSE